MCLPNILSPVFMFAFIFYCRSFSPCWPLAFLVDSQSLWIFMFFFLQNSSLLFSITRSSSFSVFHVSVNIKNNVEKDSTLSLFLLSKSPGGHAISFQIKSWVAFGLPYLLIELIYIGMPVSRMGSLPHFFTHGAPLCAFRARELRHKKMASLNVHFVIKLVNAKSVQKPSCKYPVFINDTHKVCKNCCAVNDYLTANKNDLRERIPHTWPSSHENYFQSILGSVSNCVVILRARPYWSVRVASCNF